MFTWQITSRDQAVLANLEQHRLGRVTVQRNGARSASVTISMDDAAALRVFPLACLLRAYLDGRLVFCGRITTPTFADDAGAGEGGATVTIEALDPWNHLERCFLSGPLVPLGDVEPPLTFAAVDQSTIMQALIDAVADRDHGIIEGSLWTGGTDRDRTYYGGKQIAEAIAQMSDVIGGPDFELEPIEATDGTICRFNTFEAQGSPRPAIFDYGFGQHNVAGFRDAPSGESVCNRFAAVGAAIDGIAPAYVAQSATSQAHHGGTFERVEAIDDVSESGTLEDYAKEQVRVNAFALDYFDLTLPPQNDDAFEGVDFTGSRYGQPPVAGPVADYWIGDTILARIRRNVELDVQGRIESITLEENERGTVAATITCTPIGAIATDVAGNTTSLTVAAPAA